MSGFVLGLLVGALLCGVPAGIAATLAFQWLADRPRRVVLDDYTARLRALDRNPTRVP